MKYGIDYLKDVKSGKVKAPNAYVRRLVNHLSEIEAGRRDVARGHAKPSHQPVSAKTGRRGRGSKSYDGDTILHWIQQYKLRGKDFLKTLTPYQRRLVTSHKPQPLALVLQRHNISASDLKGTSLILKGQIYEIRKRIYGFVGNTPMVLVRITSIRSGKSHYQFMRDSSIEREAKSIVMISDRLVDEIHAIIEYAW